MKTPIEIAQEKAKADAFLAIINTNKMDTDPYEWESGVEKTLDTLLSDFAKSLAVGVLEERRKYANGEDDYCHGAYKGITDIATFIRSKKN